MSSVAIGMIGAGMIGRKHLQSIAAHPRYDLVAIADVNAAAIAIQYPGTRVFADYRQLLDEAKPEAVIVAAPNQVHAEIGIECSRRGIHILMEKPVADTLEAASALVSAVRASGIRTLVGHHRRHHQQVKATRKLIEDGGIGSLIGVSAVWAAYKPDAYFEAGQWRTQPGGGPILINLVHEIDFLRFVAGEIVAVSAMASSRRRGFQVEDTAGALLQFAGGAIGTFFISDSAVSPWTMEQGLGESPEFPFSGESSYRFVGSEGALEFPELVQWQQLSSTRSWNEPISSRRLLTTTIDPYRAQLDHLYDVIRNGAPSVSTVEDGARTLIATLAISETAASGRAVDLEARYALLGVRR